MKSDSKQIRCLMQFRLLSLRYKALFQWNSKLANRGEMVNKIINRRTSVGFT